MTQNKEYTYQTYANNPVNLAAGQNWIKFVPFIFKPSFFKTLLKTIHEGKEYLEVSHWNSCEFAVNFQWLPDEIVYSKRLKRKTPFEVLLNKIDFKTVLKSYSVQGVELSKTGPYRDTWAMNKTSLEGVHNWQICRKVEVTTLHVTDVLKLLSYVFQKVYEFDISCLSARDKEDLKYNNNTLYGGASKQHYRAIPLKIRPRILRFTQDTLLNFIRNLYSEKYQKSLASALRKKEFVLGYTRDYGLFTYGQPAYGVSRNYFESGYLFKCDCCNAIKSHGRFLYKSEMKPLVADYTLDAFNERVKMRQQNLAKYSDDPQYKKVIVEDKVPLHLLNTVKAKPGNSYQEVLLQFLDNYHTRLFKTSHGLQPASIRARGGYGQVTYIDKYGIDHYKWERIEFNLIKEQDFRTPEKYQQADGGCLVCEYCYTTIYHILGFHLETNTVQVQPPTGARRAYFQYTRGGIQFTGAGGGNTQFPPLPAVAEEAIYIEDDPAPPPTTNVVIPHNSPTDGLIAGHLANPLERLDGFLLAKGETKSIRKYPTFAPKGKLVGVKEQDQTLYMGIELEVTPSEQCANFIANAIEQAPSKNSARYYYKETKYLAANVMNLFFQHYKYGMVKHDGSTGNGFEIVTVPATHKWHTEEGWKEFFNENFDKTDDTKVLAPNSWLSGWANNGGKSTNPIYQYSEDRNGVGIRPICGIHIHVSRDAITPLTLGKLMEFMSTPKNLKFLEQIAGRNEKRYAKVVPAKVKDGKAIQRFNRDGNFADPLRKYEALNIYTGKPTIEFRLFRSNVSRSGFMKNIDFVHALVTWCSQASTNPKELTVDTFVKWCNTQRGVYKYLTQWLVAHKYINTIHTFNPKYHNPISFEDLSDEHNPTAMRVA